jgi:hypothetical protein
VNICCAGLDGYFDPSAAEPVDWVNESPVVDIWQHVDEKSSHRVHLPSSRSQGKKPFRVMRLIDIAICACKVAVPKSWAFEPLLEELEVVWSWRRETGDHSMVGNCFIYACQNFVSSGWGG